VNEDDDEFPLPEDTPDPRPIWATAPFQQVIADQLKIQSPIMNMSTNGIPRQSGKNSTKPTWWTGGEFDSAGAGAFPKPANPVVEKLLKDLEDDPIALTGGERGTIVTEKELETIQQLGAYSPFKGRVGQVDISTVDLETVTIWALARLDDMHRTGAHKKYQEMKTLRVSQDKMSEMQSWQVLALLELLGGKP